MSDLPPLPPTDPAEELRDDRRSEARERALALLYEAEQRGISPADAVDAAVVPPDPLAAELTLGVGARRAEIDALLRSHAKGWTLERMAVLDRLVLSIGAYELLARSDVPVAVVLSEAVVLAKAYGTDDSGRFVNGVLAAIARAVR